MNNTFIILHCRINALSVQWFGQRFLNISRQIWKKKLKAFKIESASSFTVYCRTHALETEVLFDRPKDFRALSNFGSI